MPTTFIKIASTTVGSSGASNIDFTSIPSTYTDLCLFFSLRSNGTNGYDIIELRFNNSSGTYNMKRIYGNGASAVSETNSLNRNNIGYSDDNANTASIFSSGRVYIPNYTSSINKTLSSDNVLENNSSTAIPFIGSGTWVDTSVINQITIFPEYGTLYNQYSTASLYGIKNS